jgi:hypothetical protein
MHGDSAFSASASAPTGFPFGSANQSANAKPSLCASNAQTSLYASGSVHFDAAFGDVSSGTVYSSDFGVEPPSPMAGPS